MREKRPTVILDPGHGGSDPGAVANGLQEKKLNLMLAVQTAERLEGMRVLLTRESDIFVSLKDRVALANRAGADLYVSLHVNAGGGHGFESYIYQGLGKTDPTVLIQDTLHRRVMQILSRWNIRDRGRKKANFYVLRQTRCAAVLLESLFIDHSGEARLWKDNAFVQALAGGIADGITDVVQRIGGGSGSGSSGSSSSGGSGSGSGNSSSGGGSVGSGNNSNSTGSAGGSGGSGNSSGGSAAPTPPMQRPQVIYTVQVGAFSSLENARACLARARRAGFADAFIQTRRIP